MSKGKKSKNAHIQRNKVTYTFLNRNEIPVVEKGKRQIYVVIENGKVIGVGETNDTVARIQSGYAWCVRTMKQDGSSVISYMQQKASEVNEEGNIYHFDVKYLEQVDSKESKKTEKRWFDKYYQDGEPIKNKL